MWRVVVLIKRLLDILDFLKTTFRYILLEDRKSNLCCEELDIDKQKELEQLNDCVELDISALLFDSIVSLALLAPKYLQSSKSLKKSSTTC